MVFSFLKFKQSGQDLLSDRNGFLFLETSKGNAVRHIVSVLSKQYGSQSIWLYDMSSSYSDMEAWLGNYIDVYELEDQFSEHFSGLADQVLDERRRCFYEDRVLMISDLADSINKSGLDFQELALLIEEGKRVGLHLVMVSQGSYFTVLNDFKRFLKDKVDLALIAMRVSTQNFVNKNMAENEVAPLFDEAYLHYKDVQKRIKLTR